MSELTFTESHGNVTVEICEDYKDSFVLGWISREPNLEAVFQQSFEVVEIGFKQMAEIYAKMVEVELSGVSADHAAELERLQSQLASRDALIERLVEAGIDAIRAMGGWNGWFGIKRDWERAVAEWKAMKGGEG